MDTSPEFTNLSNGEERRAERKKRFDFISGVNKQHLLKGKAEQEKLQRSVLQAAKAYPSCHIS